MFTYGNRTYPSQIYFLRATTWGSVMQFEITLFMIQTQLSME